MVEDVTLVVRDLAAADSHRLDRRLISERQATLSTL